MRPVCFPSRVHSVSPCRTSTTSGVSVCTLRRMTRRGYARPGAASSVWLPIVRRSRIYLSIDAAPYSSSVTWSPHAAGLPSSSTSSIAMVVMKRFGAAPCQCSSPGSKKTRFAGTNHLDRPAPALRQPDALDDVDGLAVRVRVPRRPRARREVDAARAQPRALRWSRDLVEVDRAGEPLRWPWIGVAAAPSDLHRGG